MNAENILLNERVLDLETKLTESIEALNQCKKENEDFILIASHDLQAPFRKLSTFIERLVSKLPETLGDDTLVYVDKIQSTLAGMRGMIGDLSGLSEIAETIPHFKRCEPGEILDEVIKATKSLHQDVDFNISKLPAIEADPAMMKKLFENIIDNAIKFKKKEQAGHITITAEQASAEEKVVFNLPPEKVYHKIIFADNGIGFSQENAGKILNPFQRLHGKAAYPGNGLGLAICKKIMEKHLGIIYAKGNENDGAQFILILPETHP